MCAHLLRTQDSYNTEKALAWLTAAHAEERALRQKLKDEVETTQVNMALQRAASHCLVRSFSVFSTLVDPWIAPKSHAFAMVWDQGGHEGVELGTSLTRPNGAGAEGAPGSSGEVPGRNGGQKQTATGLQQAHGTSLDRGYNRLMLCLEPGLQQAHDMLSTQALAKVQHALISLAGANKPVMCHKHEHKTALNVSMSMNCTGSWCVKEQVAAGQQNTRGLSCDKNKDHIASSWWATTCSSNVKEHESQQAHGASKDIDCGKLAACPVMHSCHKLSPSLCMCALVACISVSSQSVLKARAYRCVCVLVACLFVGSKGVR
eukprot:1144213-Pelagomonas_calceolata.AAC.3